MSSLSFTATVFILCRLRSHLCGCRLCRGHHSSLRAYTSLLRSDSPSIRFVSIRFVYLDQLRDEGQATRDITHLGAAIYCFLSSIIVLSIPCYLAVVLLFCFLL
ncbi:unnamed protein product [Cuscuta campestris]|uniref:Uncharacterized protein n=1 Tax=Cuscuta campestris TaxID=132261 RepID=A0A484KHE4_9ASTE|nr:unnamed protein product [Cuscuta campestris]